MTHWLLTLLLVAATLTAGADTSRHDDDDVIRVGIFPRRPAADTQRMFQPLAAYLSERLGRHVTLELAADYPAFWSALEQGRYDLVHYNQYHYIRAHRQLGHQLVAKNEEFGETQMRATIYVRSDSRLRTLADLRGHKILFGGDESAFISYVLPTDMLRQAGLRRGDYIEQFAQNPIKAVIAMHYEQGDAAAAGDRLPDLPVLRHAIGDGKVRGLAQSIAVPQLAWAASPRLPASTREALREALLALNNGEPGRTILKEMQLTALRPATDHEYDVVRDITASVLGEKY